MGLKLTPEIKMARRLHKKHSLIIPVDLNNLISEYAQLIYKSIPIDGVDGVCINLKHPKKKTKIVVNNTSSNNRQRFTLAHELGHIIIPWHLGTIIDDIDNKETKSGCDNPYWINEREANRFASELLMPFDWLYARFLENNNLNELISFTCKNCVVSEDAARIRVGRFWDEEIDYLLPSTLIQEEYKRLQNLKFVHKSLVEIVPFHPLYVARQMTNYLKGKIAFCVEEEGIVIGCGSTYGTRSFYQMEGSKFISNPYPNYKSRYTYIYLGTKTHWWDLNINFETLEDHRSWQEILETIAHDLASDEGVVKFKRSLNGKLSGINGNWRKKYPEKDVEDFINEIMHRFNNIEDSHFFNHPDFAKFIRKRSIALFGVT